MTGSTPAPLSVLVEATGAAAARRAAAEIARHLQHCLEHRGTASVAFSGGHSPRAMLRELAVSKVDWRRVHIFQVDERDVPIGDRDRNWRMITEELLVPGRVPSARCHPMPVGESNPSAAARAYSQLLDEHAPAGLDVVHLGLGEDGHTASWAPGDRVLPGSEAVALTAEFRGHRRMTLTPRAVNCGQAIVWLITGVTKRLALSSLVAGGDTMPAHAVRREPQVVVVADQAAAHRCSP